MGARFYVIAINEDVVGETPRPDEAIQLIEGPLSDGTEADKIRRLCSDADYDAAVSYVVVQLGTDPL